MVADLFTSFFCRTRAGAADALTIFGKGLAGHVRGKLREYRGSQRGALLTKEWQMRRLARIFRSERGATAIEYALVGALISIAALAAMTNLGGKVNTMFNNVSNHM